MSREIKVIFAGNKRVNTEYKGFRVETDQPVHQGGDASAPAPFDLFLASLAACAGYYLMAFCQIRKIDTEGISVTMNTEVDPEKRMLSRIIFEAALPPDFPERYINAAVKAMEGCAIKKHFDDPPEFVSRAYFKDA